MRSRVGLVITVALILLSANIESSMGAKNSSSTVKPTQPASSNFTFFIDHRTSSSEDIRKIVTNPNNQVLSNKIITSGSPMDISILDASNGYALISEDAENTQLALLNPDGSNTPLNIYDVSDKTNVTTLDYLHLGLTNHSLIGIDYYGTLSQVDWTSGTPVWTNLMSSQSWLAAMTLNGGVPRDWVADFAMLSQTSVLVLTINTDTSQIKVWNVALSPTITASPILTVSTTSLLASTFFALSPKRDKVALIYQASQLTPVDALKIYDVQSSTWTNVSAARLSPQGHYFLAWLDETNLLTTTTYVYTSDKNGGRVVCRLNLASTNACQTIPGLSSYSLGRAS